jgi:malonyl CoA-acyl carrier protein transacylase
LIRSIELRRKGSMSSIFSAILAHSVQAFSVGGPAPVVRSLCSPLHRTLRASSLRMADDEFTYTPKTVFMFPGQGAQSIGMGVETAETVPAAAELYKKASEILGYDLLAKCKDGPKEDLDTTVRSAARRQSERSPAARPAARARPELRCAGLRDRRRSRSPHPNPKQVISQPAIFVASMAAVEKLKATEEGAATIAAADVACGLSLGEYTALCFAGAISFEDGVKITKARGEAMQAASEAASSGMVSVIGLKSDQVEALCKAAAEQSGEPVQIANYLCNGNYACSGSTAAVAKVKAAPTPMEPCTYYTYYTRPLYRTLRLYLRWPRLPSPSSRRAWPSSSPWPVLSIPTS